MSGLVQRCMRRRTHNLQRKNPALVEVNKFVDKVQINIAKA